MTQVSLNVLIMNGLQRDTHRGIEDEIDQVRLSTQTNHHSRWQSLITNRAKTIVPTILCRYVT